MKYLEVDRRLPQKKEAGAIATMTPARIATQLLLLGGLDHRLSGEEGLVDRAHVDVPALALRSFDAGQIAHRRLAGLHVGGNRADYELTLEGIDGYLRIGNRAIAISEPVDMRAEQLALLIVGVDVRREPDFRIDIDHRLAVDRVDLSTPRSRFHDVHVAHLIVLGASTRTTIQRAAEFRRMRGMNAGQHIFLADKFVVVFLDLGIEARIMIRIP